MKHLNNITTNKASGLPEIGFVRLDTILEIIPIGKSTWWAGVKEGKFPKPVKLGKRNSAWKVEDIKALIKQFEAGEFA